MKGVPDWIIQALWWASSVFATGAVWYFLSVKENGLATASACAAILFLLIAVSAHRKKDAVEAAIEASRAQKLRDLELKFIPKPGSDSFRQHTPIPAIGNLDYDEARQMLIEAGWQPLIRRPNQMSDTDIGYGNGKHFFWDRGYWELRYASGTGLAHCRFDFADVYGNRLAVVTAGEIHEPGGDTAGVCRWFFDDGKDD